MVKNDNEQKQISFKYDKKLLDRFQAVAKANNSTATQEIRKFILEYLKTNAQTKMNF